jgi:hypothetical protein
MGLDVISEGVRLNGDITPEPIPDPRCKQDRNRHTFEFLPRILPKASTESVWLESYEVDSLERVKNRDWIV